MTWCCSLMFIILCNIITVSLHVRRYYRYKTHNISFKSKHGWNFKGLPSLSSRSWMISLRLLTSFRSESSVSLARILESARICCNSLISDLYLFSKELSCCLSCNNHRYVINQQEAHGPYSPPEKPEFKSIIHLRRAIIIS